MDRQTFEKESFLHLKDVTGRMEEEQRKLLSGILSREKDTLYGRSYHFKEIRSAAEFQRRLPYSGYEDYEELIGRQIQGEKGVFLSENPFFYCISSGSTGEPKYLPLKEEDAALQHLYLYGALPAMVRRELGEEESVKISRFQTVDVFRTFMPEGTPSGVRSGLAPVYAKEMGRFPYEEYYAPGEVLFPDRLEDMLYVKLRFALAAKNITDIEGIFVHKLVGMFQFMERRREELLYDIEKGCVSSAFTVDSRWKRFIEDHLPPDPERARELAQVFASGERNLAKKIWPDLRLCRTICGMQFVPYQEMLKEYIGGIPVHSFAYAASEGFLGIAHGMDMTGTYILLPDSCFYEFIPEDDEDRVILAQELEEKKRYELVITTRSGLYRYRIGDVIEVIGWYGEAPLVRICYRKNQILSIVDEKYNVSQFEEAMNRFLSACGIRAEGYCIMGDYGEMKPCYRLLLETRNRLPESAEEILDQSLSAGSMGYRTARELSEIGGARISLLKRESFRDYERMRVQKGYRTEQTKPLRVLTREEDIRFFQGRLG